MALTMVVLICAWPAYFVYLRVQAWAPNLDRTTQVEPDVQLYRPNSELGYVATPGKYRLTEIVKGVLGQLSYDVTILEDHSRATSPEKEEQQKKDKPQIWIFGCSFTWGQGLNDWETYPYKIQSKFPNYNVKNFGDNGYGTTHSLVHLRELLNEGNRPAAIVIGHITWHDQRNIGDPNYLQALYWFSAFSKKGMFGTLFELANYKIHVAVNGQEEAAKLAEFKFPVAFLNESTGEISVKAQPMLPESLPASGDPTKTTAAILRDIGKLSAKVGVKPVLLRLWNDGADPLEKVYAELGFEFQDALIEYNQNQWNNNPWNNHPNNSANDVYADKLGQVLKRVLK